MKPTGWPLHQVAPDCVNRFFSAEVHVGGFPSHEIQETMFVALLRQVVNWNPAAVRREAAAKPRPIHQNKRIAATDCAVEHRLVKDRTRIGFTAGPDTSRRRQRLGFTRNLRAAPISYGHDSITSQTSQARYMRHKPVR